MFYNEAADTIYIDCLSSMKKLTADGKITEIQTDNDKYSFQNTDAVLGISLMEENYSKNKDLINVRAVSLSTGKTLWNSVIHSGWGVFTKNDTVMFDNITTGKNGISALRCMDNLTGEKKGVYAYDGEIDRVYGSSKSSICIISEIEGSDNITFFNAADGTSAKVDIGLKDINIYGAEPLDDHTWILAVEAGNDADVISKTVIIDTDELEYSKLPEGVDVETKEEYQHEPCGDLQAQRELADELEEKYGVEILIGDEVLETIGGQKTWTSVADMWYDEYPDDLTEQLNWLDDWMAAYPEGFFEKFNTENYNGYRLVMIGDYYNNINDPDAISVTGGMTSVDLVDGYIDVSLPFNILSDIELGQVADHETWHAVEFLVTAECGDIDEEAWSALNPEEMKDLTFDYDNLLDEITYQKINKYFIRYNNKENYENGYYVRDYSVTNAMEDRATLMEFVRPSFTASGAYYLEDTIAKYPHIVEKLKFMGEWSEQLFGYVYWDEMIANKRVLEPGEALG